MDGIFAKLTAYGKRRIRYELKKTKDARYRVRCNIVLMAANGGSPSYVARTLVVSRTTVYSTMSNYSESGLGGLVDGRKQSQCVKVDEDYLQALSEVVKSCAHDHGWPRPTWTREMLIITLEKLTKVRVSFSSMSRALAKIGARHGRARPIVLCPWSKRRKRRRLQEIQKAVESAGRNSVVYYEDEVDIHLNPKIGADWMIRGQQKEIVTPGKNVKRYLAGALNRSTGELVWVESSKKNAVIFLELLWKLLRMHPGKTIT